MANEDTLKNSPLLEEHLKLGARMVPFAGWNMPVQYSEGIIQEHKHTREQVSVFDICHMGEFRVSGKGSAKELDKLFPRNVVNQKIGSCRYNFLLTDQGTVIDDLIIYRIKEDEFFIVVNAGTKDNDAKYIKTMLPESILFQDESEETAKIDLQGPQSAEILINLGLNKDDLPNYYKWININIGGYKCLLSRTGYTGELGFELYISTQDAVNVWNLLLSQNNVKPAGLGARDTLRLEMGYPLYGHEMDIKTTPIEAGFGGMIKLDSDRSFCGKESLIKKEKQSNGKYLIGIEFDGRRAAREGAEILFNDNIVGTVTSGTFSPSLQKAIAFAYINLEDNISINDTIKCKVGRSEIVGKRVALPFYKKGSVRS